MSESEIREKIHSFRTIIRQMEAALITQEQRSSIQRLADAMAVFEKALAINEETFSGICGVRVEVDPHIKEYHGFKVGDELQLITKKVSPVLSNAKKHVVVGFNWHFDIHTENSSMRAVIQIDGNLVVEVPAATMNKLYKLAKKGDELKPINYRLAKLSEAFLSQIDSMLAEMNKVLENIQQHKEQLGRHENQLGQPPKENDQLKNDEHRRTPEDFRRIEESFALLAKDLARKEEDDPRTHQQIINDNINEAKRWPYDGP